MSKLTINLGELEKGNNQQKNKDFKKEGTNLYAFLLFKALNMNIKNNYLFIEPNYKLINFNLELYFTHKSQEYKLAIDGQNKTIIAREVRLININKLDLNFLKTQKSS
jgi:hypothetical protein